MRFKTYHGDGGKGGGWKQQDQRSSENVAQLLRGGVQEERTECGMFFFCVSSAAVVGATEFCGRSVHSCVICALITKIAEGKN